MNLFQIEALLITATTFVLSLLLAFYMTRKYRKTRSKPLRFWSLGMQAFSVGVFIEVVFAIGVESNLLVSFYFFLVAMIVELLALGSIQLLKSKQIKNVYYVFCLITTILLLLSVIAYKSPGFVSNYVAWGVPPLLVTIFSTIITIPASLVILAVAIKGYLKTKSVKMISIIAGVIFVGIAGTLYIVSFPSLLYASEFIGILLLWSGFYGG